MAIYRWQGTRWRGGGQVVAEQRCRSRLSITTAGTPWVWMLAEAERSPGDDSERRTIIDARPSGRFWGTAPEPRKGLAGGHVPGSINIPATALLDEGNAARFKPMRSANSCWVSPRALRKIFRC